MPLQGADPTPSFGGFGLKRAWYGTHHHYTKGFALAYVVEACFKYNNRGKSNVFESFIREAVAA